MSRHAKTTADPAVAISRIAWLLTFVVPLILALLLLAQAAPASPFSSDAPVAFDEEFEAEAEEEEFEEEDECEEAEEEFEEGEISEAEVREHCDEDKGKGGKRAAKSNSVAPEECLLRSAHARAVADPDHHALKLTVGYTTYEAVGATLEIRGGSASIGSLHRHLGRSGVLRIVKHLGKDQPPHRLVVRIRIPASPGYCNKFLTQKIRTSFR